MIVYVIEGSYHIPRRNDILVWKTQKEADELVSVLTPILEKVFKKI